MTSDLSPPVAAVPQPLLLTEHLSKGPSTGGLPPQASEPPVWVVLDTRTAEHGVNSGVSRFVVGLAGGLAEVLALRNEASPQCIRVLLVGKHEPHAWIVSLVQRYPHIVSYWSGGPGALTRKKEKPVWLWPSRVVSEIAQRTGERFLWVAPGNLDRPLLWPFGRSRWKNRLVQVVHDTIPFKQKGSMGFFFRVQFCWLVKRTLGSFPHVFTVSDHSAADLARIAPKRLKPVAVVGNGIEPVFGNYGKVFGPDRVSARLRLLALLFPQAEEPSQRGMFERLARARWVVSVGRYQKYKSWESVEEATSLLQGSFSEGAWLLRVGLCARDAQRLAKVESQPLGLGTVFPSLHMLGLPELSDTLLSVLYSLSDVCAHPSRAEGFGLPPLESAFCGTPVVYRKGTAVDDHFAQGTRLPVGFATALESNEPHVWAQALAEVMQQGDRPGTELHALFAHLARCESARDFMGSRLGASRYEWPECARRFLDALFAPALDAEART
ncbi:MAG: glycosyltransferase [Silvanigrellales bacterium]|nr:glycosyltransferase [Silvanigrellales bacterium]